MQDLSRHSRVAAHAVYQSAIANAPYRRPFLLRRRSLMMGGVVLVIALATGLAELAQTPRAVSIRDAQQFLQQSGDRLATILNGPGDWVVKRSQLEALIAQCLDVHGIARF